LQPSLLVLFKQSEQVKIPIVVEVFSGFIANPLERDIITVTNALLETKTDFFANEIGSTLVDYCALCSLEGSDDFVGLAFLDSSHSVVGVKKFKIAVPREDVRSLLFKQFTLHVILNADLEFIHTVLGLQSCSSSYPCCLCLVKLEELRRDRSIHCGALRTRDQMLLQLEAVNKGDSLAQKKKIAQRNGSVIREALIPINLDRVMLPILHLIEDIHKMEQKECPEVCMMLEARDNLSRHTSILVEVKEQVFNDFSIADKQRQETLKLYNEARKITPPLPAQELRRIEVQYDYMKMKAKDAEEKKKAINSKEINCYAAIVKEINEFLRVKQGPMERALEYVISIYPISAKHNPYYGGSFNGNDCMRILENVTLLFQSLFNATDSNETATVIIQNHYDIWESFAAIVPLLRSRRKFTSQEQHDLLLDTKEFSNQYKNKSSSNVTYKMHLLFAHLQDRLSTYHTVGLFSEDSMESIHAVINRLDRVYASLDSERKTKAILQSITATKKRSVAVQSNKLSKSDSARDIMLQKQKRRQGVAKKSKSVSVDFVDMTALLAPAATASLRNWTWNTNDIKEDDYPGRHLNYNEILCEHCKEHLNCDERISTQLADLHYLLRHIHTDSKFNVSKTD
jgi:hypothetical protein